MDFAYSPKVEALRAELGAFMDRHVVPRLADWQHEVEAGVWPPSMIEPLKQQARAAGLWNLFLPGLREDEPGTRLTNLEYAPLAEIMGRVFWASEIFNCSAPDTGNMELLHLFATPEQRERWLDPLLNGEIRSCFAMTEPDVASSDATNIATRIERDGAHYVINGRKWFITNAADPRCRICIVMGVTDPAAERHRRHSMVLVPMDTPASPWCATCRSCTTSPRRGTARCGLLTCACPSPICWVRKARASRSPRRGSGPGASTTACARSASASWRSS